MIFSSILFLVYFLPIFTIIYQFLPKGLKNYFILFASIVFYSWGAPKFLFLLLGSIIINYYLVDQIEKSLSLKKRKVFLVLSISINLGLLLYFKYANFFVANVNAILQSFGASSVNWTKIALPIGISFFTFQSLTYSVDVYRKVHKPLRKLTDYMLYILSFPQMIAGPIVRFNTIADQIITRDNKVDDKLIGFMRFSIGLAKKVLIANTMGEQADIVFSTGTDPLSFTTAWIGILAYTMQIYFDFSGYSDMAIGLGKIMGFSFPENFNSPYISKSISEFWRRWHITLGQWMKDYLYIPLGGNRVDSKMRLYLNLWFVFLVSGFWHGASWNFIIWGAYHGIFLIFDRLFLLKFYKKIGGFFSTVITFIVVMVGWVFFRIEGFTEAITYIQYMFGLAEASTQNIVPISGFYLTLMFALFFSFISAFPIGSKLEAVFFNKKDYDINTIIVLLAISSILYLVSLSFLSTSGFNPFIYFRF